MSTLTVETLCTEAALFSAAESRHPEPLLYGVTDGKAVGTYLEQKFRLECRLPRGVIDDRVAVLLSRSAAIAKLRLGDRVSVQLPGGYSHSNGTFMAINHQARTVRVHWSETNLILDCNFVDLLPAHP